MKHLFIINPVSGQLAGRVNKIDEIKNEINHYFAANPARNYAMHFCRWKRDASGYTQRYVSSASEMVRVYAMGGNGTLFEVINGAVGLPNVQVAWYPLGKANSMLYAFVNAAGADSTLSLFQSLQNLTLSPVIALDTIRAGNHYMIMNALLGAEAEAYRSGEDLADRVKLPRNACYLAAGLFNALLKKHNQFYSFETEYEKAEGVYNSILVTNTPTYGLGLRPALDALFNDGYMDVYTVKSIPRNKVFTVVMDYERGLYRKWPEYIHHYRCKKFRVFSDSTITISLDGSLFYNNVMDFEICPHSLDFVCPLGINMPVISKDGAREPEEEFTFENIEDLAVSLGSPELPE
jgi:diacylglycerol kinase family enzyme